MKENIFPAQELSQAVDTICTEELNRLELLYRLSPSELKRVEHERLIQYSINLPLTAQNRVKAVFEKAQIRYLHTAWKTVSEGLPTFSYRYIDWEQLQNGSPRVHISISVGRPSNNRKHKHTPPPSPTAQQLISSAQAHNKVQVKQWCAVLEERARAVLEEQGTSA